MASNDEMQAILRRWFGDDYLDPSELGNCDACNALYDLSSRDGRCGDCDECAEHCNHRSADPDWAVCQACGVWYDLNINSSCPGCKKAEI